MGATKRSDTSWLDHAFNLASAVKGALIGSAISVLILGAAVFFPDTTLTYVIDFGLIAIVIVTFSIIGGREAPVASESPALKKYIKTTRWLSFLSMFGGRPMGKDVVVPEVMTVRNFLWLVLWLVNFILISIFVFPFVGSPLGQSTNFFMFLLVGFVLYLVRPLWAMAVVTAATVLYGFIKVW